MPDAGAARPAARPARRAAADGAAGGTRRFEAKRAAILDAAAQRFNTQGLKGATLADIAGDVGLVTTSVTYYYRRKEDLAVACLERAIAVHQALADAALHTGHDSASRTAAFLRAEAGLPAAQAQGLQSPLIEFNDIRALPEAQAEGVFNGYNHLFRAVRRLLAPEGGERAERAERSDGPARLALNARAHLLLSTAHSLRAWLSRYEWDDHPRVAERVVQMVLHGLAGGASAWPSADALAVLPPADPDGSAPQGMADAFLRAATELLNEQGFRGASVDRIAARLQLTKGAFYHHHDTKLDVISACFDRTHAVVRRTLRAAEEAHGLGWQRACAATAALVRLQLSEHGPLLRASAMSPLPDGLAREQVLCDGRRLNERLVGVLVDGMVDGSVRPLDPALAASWLSSSTNAAAELQRWAPGIDADTAVALYARPALMGLLATA